MYEALGIEMIVSERSMPGLCSFTNSLLTVLSNHPGKGKAEAILLVFNIRVPYSLYAHVMFQILQTWFLTLELHYGIMLLCCSTHPLK